MVPPLVGVAVNVNDEPAHEGLVPVVKAIATEGATLVFTVIVMAFEVAVTLAADFVNFILGLIEPELVTVVVAQAPAPAEPSI